VPSHCIAVVPLTSRSPAWLPYARRRRRGEFFCAAHHDALLGAILGLNNIARLPQSPVTGPPRPRIRPCPKNETHPHLPRRHPAPAPPPKNPPHAQEELAQANAIARSSHRRPRLTARSRKLSATPRPSPRRSPPNASQNHTRPPPRRDHLHAGRKNRRPPSHRHRPPAPPSHQRPQRHHPRPRPLPQRRSPRSRSRPRLPRAFASATPCAAAASTNTKWPAPSPASSTNSATATKTQEASKSSSSTSSKNAAATSTRHNPSAPPQPSQRTSRCSTWSRAQFARKRRRNNWTPRQAPRHRPSPPQAPRHRPVPHERIQIQSSNVKKYSVF
jgi:hypothetical protein